MAKKRVLFVCMGNICRSPAAEGVMQHLVEKRGLQDQVEVDSAGTISYHVGERADPRMIRCAEKRGFLLKSIARQVTAADLECFDYILAADPANLADLEMLDHGGRYKHKLAMITSYHPDPAVDHVPDPYYGGDAGFEKVIDILTVSCERLLDRIEEDLKTEGK
jgi:protein-tyrosine phosphatase